MTPIGIWYFKAHQEKGEMASNEIDKLSYNEAEDERPITNCSNDKLYYLL